LKLFILFLIRVDAKARHLREAEVPHT
jgi:hypothetical protein